MTVHDRLGLSDTLLNLFSQKLGLVLIGLEEETDPVSVVVHGEVGQPGAGVGVHNNLVAALNIDNNGLAGHGVLVVVLVVLVEDAGNLLAVLADGQQGLLVVMSGNVEHEQIATANGGGEDTGIGVESTTNVAVGAVEGQVLLTATVVGLASVGVEVDAEGLVGETSEELVLLHHAGSQVLNIALSFLVVSVHASLNWNMNKNYM